jgi:hypothetical protein
MHSIQPRSRGFFLVEAGRALNPLDAKKPPIARGGEICSPPVILHPDIREPLKLDRRPFLAHLSGESRLRSDSTAKYAEEGGSMGKWTNHGSGPQREAFGRLHHEAGCERRAFKVVSRSRLSHSPLLQAQSSHTDRPTVPCVCNVSIHQAMHDRTRRKFERDRWLKRRRRRLGHVARLGRERCTPSCGSIQRQEHQLRRSQSR